MTNIENGKSGWGTRILTRRNFLVTGSAGLVGLIIGGGIKAVRETTTEQAAVAAGNTPQPDKTPVSTATSTATVTNSPTPTETPKPKTGYLTNKDGSLGYLTEKGEILNVPQVPGFKAELQNNKVVYLAETNNPYGLQEKQYGGEFVPNVSMAMEDGKQKETGGLILTSPVVLKLINDKLATIPNQKDKWIVAIPLDTRELNPTENVMINREISGVTGGTLLRIDYKGEASIANIIPDNKQLRIAKGTVYGGWTSLDYLRYFPPYTDRISPGKEMHYLTVTGNFVGFTTNITVDSKFGQKVAKGTGPLRISFSAAKEWSDTTFDKVLSVNNHPVFIAADNP